MAIYTGYIGTYTKGDSKGVYSFTLDTESKKVENIKLAAELGSPTYVTIVKTGKHYMPWTNKMIKAESLPSTLMLIQQLLLN